jgi:hypothetical protein
MPTLLPKIFSLHGTLEKGTTFYISKYDDDDMMLSVKKYHEVSDIFPQ